MPTDELYIEGTLDLPCGAQAAWERLRDPVAYFGWNPVAELLTEVPEVKDGLRLQCRAPLLGTFTYVHRLDELRKEVVHEVPLRIGLRLGEERHIWRVTAREGGCQVHQIMEVRLTTWAGRLLGRFLERQLRDLHGQNFARLASAE
jgi:hypothetical protein